MEMNLNSTELSGNFRRYLRKNPIVGRIMKTKTITNSGGKISGNWNNDTSLILLNFY